MAPTYTLYYLDNRLLLVTPKTIAGKLFTIIFKINLACKSKSVVSRDLKKKKGEDTFYSITYSTLF